VIEMRYIALVDVPDLGSGNTARRRYAVLVEDRETIVVASRLPGEIEAVTELQFKLADAEQLARDCLAGERRAVTMPGLVRRLSAFALVLSRVCHAANAFQHIEGWHDSGDPDDRAEAEGDGPVA
jgi:hypothetical protein